MGKINVIGKRFGNWEVLEDTGYRKNGKVFFKCKCHGICKEGTLQQVESYKLRTGHSNSCKKCKTLKQTVHGNTTHTTASITYNSWHQMKQRCHNPNDKAYKNYGGRGVFVCRRWRKSFKKFLKDVGERPGKEYTAHRIDNNGPYAPWNFKWATWKEQQDPKNKRRSKNSKLYEWEVREIRTLLNKGRKAAELAKIYRVNKSTIFNIKYRNIWKHVK